jgi:multiple sugar transport system permease protein
MPAGFSKSGERRGAPKASRRSGVFLAAPYLLFFAIFVAYPLCFALGLVFCDWDMMRAPRFVGLRNFAMLLTDSVFWLALWNTIKFLLVHISLQLVVALAIALTLNRKIALRGFFRTAFFLPVVVSGVVVTILWKQIYDTDTGALNQLLGLLGLKPVAWLTHPAIAMPAIALMATWKNVGFYVVLFLAGLQSIPGSLYEAASVEGASPGEKFRSITLPMLSPVIFLVLVLSTINGFKLFVEPYVMTGGGPDNSTISMVLYLYKQAFDYQHTGYSATLGFALAFFILLTVLVQRRFLERDYLSFGWLPVPTGRFSLLPAGLRVPARARRVLLYVALAAAALVFVYPFIWMVTATLKPPREAMTLNPFAGEMTLENYRLLFRSVPLARSLLNSLIVTGLVTSSVLLFGAMVGYALARLEFRGKKLVGVLMLINMMVPNELLLIPLYSLITRLGWPNTYQALILPYALTAMSIMMFRQFFVQVPEELAEAARVEGCSELQILFKVFLPISRPVFITVGIITFVGAWNEVLWPLIVIKDPARMTLPQAVALFAVGQGAGDLGVQLAGALILSLPVVVAYLFFQRYFIEGMATSGLKG